jgi:hypothetical protein
VGNKAFNMKTEIVLWIGIGVDAHFSENVPNVIVTKETMDCQVAGIDSDGIRR